MRRGTAEALERVLLGVEEGREERAENKAHFAEWYQRIWGKEPEVSELVGDYLSSERFFRWTESDMFFSDHALDKAPLTRVFPDSLLLADLLTSYVPRNMVTIEPVCFGCFERIFMPMKYRPWEGGRVHLLRIAEEYQRMKLVALQFLNMNFLSAREGVVEQLREQGHVLTKHGSHTVIDNIIDPEEYHNVVEEYIQGRRWCWRVDQDPLDKAFLCHKCLHAATFMHKEVADAYWSFSVPAWGRTLGKRALTDIERQFFVVRDHVVYAFEKGALGVAEGQSREEWLYAARLRAERLAAYDTYHEFSGGFTEEELQYFTFEERMRLTPVVSVLRAGGIVPLLRELGLLGFE